MFRPHAVIKAEDIDRLTLLTVTGSMYLTRAPNSHGVKVWPSAERVHILSCTERVLMADHVDWHGGSKEHMVYAGKVLHEKWIYRSGVEGIFSFIQDHEDRPFHSCNSRPNIFENQIRNPAQEHPNFFFTPQPGSSGSWPGRGQPSRPWRVWESGTSWRWPSTPPWSSSRPHPRPS